MLGLSGLAGTWLLYHCIVVCVYVHTTIFVDEFKMTSRLIFYKIFMNRAVADNSGICTMGVSIPSMWVLGMITIGLDGLLSLYPWMLTLVSAPKCRIMSRHVLMGRSESRL